ncbi:MAG TPA: histidine kinase [Nocardioidaceae bacterium]|nr:histidine kinase [Nocardioidaceae bacterium]
MRKPPRPPTFDLALSGGLVAAGLAEAATVDTGTSPVAHGALVVVVMGALAWRRSYPLAVIVVALVGILVGGRPDTPFTLFVAILVAAYTCGLVLEGRRALVGLLIAVGPPFVGVAVDDGDPADLVAIAVLYGGSWVVGRLVRDQTRRADEYAEKAAELERADADRRAQAAAEERARIARELHDIISHSISVITVQTQAVRRRLGPEHEREAADLRAVESSARQAMVELRRLFGVLRAEGERPPLAPQPGLDQLPRLLERTRAASLPVELTVEGEQVTLPPGIDLTAYRIVQECLTNALKHAGDASVRVTLRYGPQDLQITVSDDGRGARSNGYGHGHGLVGMEERVALYGGRFRAEAGETGGFTVDAQLPLGEVVS